MAGSHMEEVGEQVRGKDLEPLTKGRRKKDNSHDALTSLDGRARLEVAMADTKEGMDLMEQSMGRSWRILGCRSKTFKRGCKACRS